MILREDDRGAHIPGSGWLGCHLPTQFHLMHWFFNKAQLAFKLLSTGFQLQTLNRQPLSPSIILIHLLQSCNPSAPGKASPPNISKLRVLVGSQIPPLHPSYKRCMHTSHFILNSQSRLHVTPFYVVMHLNTLAMRKMVSLKNHQVRVFLHRKPLSKCRPWGDTWKSSGLPTCVVTSKGIHLWLNHTPIRHVKLGIMRSFPVLGTSQVRQEN